MRACRAVLTTLALALASCGGDATPSPAGPAPATACEPGRCLEDIAATVKQHRARARGCYDDRLAKQPDLQGNTVQVNFAIEADGTVREASQSVKGEQIEDPELVDCLVGVIQEITFAKSAAGKRTRAYHSFEFGSRRPR